MPGDVRVNVLWQPFVRGAAEAGVHFTAAQGSVVFEPGDHVQRLRVAVAASPVWQPALDFYFRLSRPSANATLNKFSRCRVWLLHTHAYPSKAIETSSSRLDLLKEFYKK